MTKQETYYPVTGKATYVMLTSAVLVGVAGLSLVTSQLALLLLLVVWQVTIPVIIAWYIVSPFVIKNNLDVLKQASWSKFTRRQKARWITSTLASTLPFMCVLIVVYV